MTLILDGDTGLSDVDGSAATPAIRGTDTNTGVYFPGADRLGFSTGGVQCGEFDASGNFLMNSGYGSAAVAYGCRAWVNFNGTSTVAIRASGNVTSITDNGTGDYTVNFTTALADANYSANGTAKIVGGTGGQNVRIHNDAYATSVTTTALKIQVTSAANAAVADSEMVNIAIHR